MLPRRWVAFAVGLLAILPAAAASTQGAPGDRVELVRESAFIGERVAVTLHVVVPRGATVELTPGTPSWAGVEVVSVQTPRVLERGEQSEWVLDVTVAPFTPGAVQFAPSVAVITGAEVTARVLPPVALNVIETLGPDDPLELSPLPPPVAIPGAESPLLRPALILAAAVVVTLLALAAWWGLRRHLRRPRGAGQPLDATPEAPGLAAAEAILQSDPVSAYRVMSSVVKTELTRRHAIPATALTSTELRRRLEERGVDRWQARLVGGLLEECDAVIYAGYRPALERRHADLNMAREIVEVGA